MVLHHVKPARQALQERGDVQPSQRRVSLKKKLSSMVLHHVKALTAGFARTRRCTALTAGFARRQSTALT